MLVRTSGYQNSGTDRKATAGGGTRGTSGCSGLASTAQAISQVADSTIEPAATTLSRSMCVPILCYLTQYTGAQVDHHGPDPGNLEESILFVDGTAHGTRLAS